MTPPRSPASHGALPPEGALAALGRPGGGEMTPPRSPASHGALALQAAARPEPVPLRAVQARAGEPGAAALSPEGALAALGRPGGGEMTPPRSPASHGALALQAAARPEPVPLRAVQARAGEPGAAALSPEGAPSTSGRPGDGAAGFDNALVRQFPNITNVDMSATITQIQRVMDQVIRAVEFLFGFTLVAGLIVLFAAVSATREERAREFAIMRAVGAGSALLGRVQRAELAGVGLLAGVLASVAAVAVGWAMARYAFDFAWTASPWVPLAGGAAGALLALAAGWWGLREVLRRPVVETLRRAAE